MVKQISVLNILKIVVGFLVVAAIGFSILHFIRKPYNPGFIKYSLITSLHIIPGILYLLLAPFQFMALSRRKGWIDFHRKAGRVLLGSALLVGLTAFFMSVVIPFSGLSESIIAGFFSLVFIWSIVQGYLSIKAKKVAAHREWMIRTFSLGIGIATSRIIFLPLYFSIVSPTLQDIQSLFIVCFAVAFSLHLFVAEMWIRKTRV